MPDPHDLPHLLARDLADVRWPPPTRIRARGRRRTLRTVAVAPVAVVLILASVWLLVRPSHQDAAPPPVGSTPTVSVPVGWFGPEALVQPADVGEGYHLDNQHAFAPGEDPSWSFSMDQCPAYAGLGIEKPHAYTWKRINIVTEQAGAGGDRDVFANLSRYPANAAQQVMADARQAVAACPEYSYEGGEGSTKERPARTVHRRTILQEGFAGDDSLMIRHTYHTVDASTGRRLTDVQEGTALIVAMRVGDRVEVLETYHDDPAWLREIAVRAARRL
jgi:hypothetical protein